MVFQSDPNVDNAQEEINSVSEGVLTTSNGVGMINKTAVVVAAAAASAAVDDVVPRGKKRVMVITEMQLLRGEEEDDEEQDYEDAEEIEDTHDNMGTVQELRRQIAILHEEKNAIHSSVASMENTIKTLQFQNTILKMSTSMKKYTSSNSHHGCCVDAPTLHDEEYEWEYEWECARFLILLQHLCKYNPPSKT